MTSKIFCSDETAVNRGCIQKGVLYTKNVALKGVCVEEGGGGGIEEGKGGIEEGKGGLYTQTDERLYERGKM